MTHDRSAWPLGKRTDVDLLEGVVSLVRWSWVVAVWLGWTSWEPWRSICGANLEKNSKQNERGSRRGSKKVLEGKMIGHAGICRAQNIRCFTAA